MKNKRKNGLGKKTVKQRIVVIKCRVYLCDFVAIFGGKLSEAKKWFNMRYGQHLDEEDRAPSVVAHTAADDETKNVMIWFKEMRPGARWVTHETLHAVSHVLRCAGIKHNYSTEEAYAYLQTWLVDQIGQEIWWKKK